MPKRKIVGVDFSGRQKRNTTEVTLATLSGSVLDIQLYRRRYSTCSDTHYELIELLTDLPSDAVIALDFPFSVPWLFARELAWARRRPIPSTMSDLWSIVIQMDAEEFNTVRKHFVGRHGKPYREGDLNLGGIQSPLDEKMWKMTYQGMQMLYRLWSCNGPRFRVPPLQDEDRDGPILLETMPGVLLRRFGLPSENYKVKNKTNRREPEIVRWEIVQGLETKSPVLLNIPDCDCNKCIENDNYSDSLIAAICAAMWVQNPDQFREPKPEQQANIQLEGWIYVPTK